MEERETTELVTVEQETGIQPLNLGMLQGVTPQQMLAEAAAIATPLKAFIKERGLFRFFGGEKPHVEATGWSTMLIMLGVAPQEISVTEIPVDVEGYGPKYVSKMALVRISDQQIVCQASAECGGEDEREWHFKNKYEYPDGVKTLVGEVPIPGNVRRSMATTRAVGKASRVGFAWIMEIAGYAPTPADEMPVKDEEPDRRPEAAASPREMMNKNKKPQQQENNAVPQQMKSKFGFTCLICGGSGAGGEEIAFKRGKNGGAQVAHWDCYLDSKNAQEGC